MSQAPKKVVVIGGGVAGLTAAHELQGRGFEVVVCERNTVLGGKARSLRVETLSNNDLRLGPHPGLRDVYPSKDIIGLPAEHGFRFFPGFYRHLTDTLSRIPSPSGPGRHVIDDLVNVELDAYAQPHRPFFYIPTHRPMTVYELISALTRALSHPALGVPPHEAAFAVYKLVDAFTMCLERREHELDGRSWWDYMHADTMSQRYRSVAVEGLTQNFVAMDAKMSSTKSVINILARLLNDFLRPGGTIDRVLDGPTSEVWIEQWRAHLEATRKEEGQSPVKFRMGKQGVLDQLLFHEASSRITGIKLGDGSEIQADYFVAAVPIESMIDILNKSNAAIQTHAPSLALLKNPALKVNWMSGLLYYLHEDETMGVGHVVYLKSPWALTSISQNQFWRRKVVSYPPQKAGGILSVIISDWFETSARIHKTAQQTDNPRELAVETLAQIRDSLDGRMSTHIDWHNIVGFYLDPALEFQSELITDPNTGFRVSLMGLMPAREFSRRKADLIEGFAPPDSDLALRAERNLEPLFINTVNSWNLRPHARTEIDNLLLASDYVRTRTDLATMEGANEAARWAVNGILEDLEEKEKVRFRRCSLFMFDEPAVFAPFRRIDKWLFDRGLPHGPFTLPKIARRERV
jgi:uncharacterized protein with NAD-binding domain and iron-sulfur cluster